MTKHPRYCVVLSYDEDLQQLTAHAVESNVMGPILGERMGVLLADEEDFQLDDEFARQLGVAMLNTIALGQPAIKEYISFTERPADSPPDDS
jgi:hypothetical protein